ncbi:hypothetical protein DUI87_26824 [Hirundo rustica rustica]|uniref:Thyroglobulin type-1 domain-containing protein n=1 Tax=Hirundo rustica rustica TaxID=333673 RepID=A0A3M0J7A3_HIRRU|nr:hypothetical protein DUI87_26824 [Hirundo rustica rustica]
MEGGSWRMFHPRQGARGHELSNGSPSLEITREPGDRDCVLPGMDVSPAKANNVHGLQQQSKASCKQAKVLVIKLCVEMTFELPRPALDPSKDPCLKVKCSPHKVCVTHDYETAICVSRKQLVHSLRQKKGNLAQKHWAGAANVAKCKPCPGAHSSAVCGSDGHTYSTKKAKQSEFCAVQPTLHSLFGLKREPEVDIRLEDLKPIVGFPAADPNKITSLEQHPVECGMLSPHIAAPFGGWGSVQHLEFGQCKMEFHACTSGKTITARCEGPCPCLPGPESLKHKTEKTVTWHKVASEDWVRAKMTFLVIVVDIACTDKELRNLASRLKDWFGALHEDANRVIKPTSSETAQGRFDTSILPICKDSLGWMFNKLDMNYDLLLDPSEISAIYLDKYEPCVKPLFNSCDSFKDGKLSNNEWCYCFQKPGGAFIPRCNEEGYYKATQCHGSTGQCWCVDKYGNEIAGSRKQGTVSCEEEQETSGDFGSGGSVVLLDDLEEEPEATKKDKEGKLKIHVRAANEDDEDEDDDKDDEIGYIW